MSRKTTYYCDRCGKEMKYEPYKIRRIVKSDWSILFERTTYERELCRECIESHKKFLEGEKLVCERYDEIYDELVNKHEIYVGKPESTQ